MSDTYKHRLVRLESQMDDVLRLLETWVKKPPWGRSRARSRPGITCEVYDWTPKGQAKPRHMVEVHGNHPPKRVSVPAVYSLIRCLGLSDGEILEYSEASELGQALAGYVAAHPAETGGRL